MDVYSTKRFAVEQNYIKDKISFAAVHIPAQENFPVTFNSQKYFIPLSDMYAIFWQPCRDSLGLSLARASIIFAPEQLDFTVSNPFTQWIISHPYLPNISLITYNLPFKPCFPANRYIEIPDLLYKDKNKFKIMNEYNKKEIARIGKNYINTFITSEFTDDYILHMRRAFRDSKKQDVVENFLNKPFDTNNPLIYKEIGENLFENLEKTSLTELQAILKDHSFSLGKGLTGGSHRKFVRI